MSIICLLCASNFPNYRLCPLSPQHAPLFSMNLKSPVHTDLILCLRWDMRLREATASAGLVWLFESTWFSEQSWVDVVIKCVSLWEVGPCSGSWLKLRATGKILAYNSSTDEQRADLSAAEAKPDKFLSTCRIVSGITMKAKVQARAPSLSPLLVV